MTDHFVFLATGVVFGYMLHIWKTWGDEASKEVERENE